jgi:hypothetical protein
MRGRGGKLAAASSRTRFLSVPSNICNCPRRMLRGDPLSQGHTQNEFAFLVKSSDRP